jgi:DNA-binding MarR family transcriptional regulator
MDPRERQPLKATGGSEVLSPPESAHPWPPLGEELEFLRLLWAVAHRLSSTSKVMEASLGVTGLQRLVLRLVGQYPGITATRLAHILHLNSSTLTGVLKRLEQRGYVERQEDPRDARHALLSLTEGGRALDVPAEGTVEAAVQRLLLRVPAEHLSAARELLTTLADELCPSEGTPRAGGPGAPDDAIWLPRASGGGVLFWSAEGGAKPTPE